jgi:hypothetical protein
MCRGGDQFPPRRRASRHLRRAVEDHEPLGRGQFQGFQPQQAEKVGHAPVLFGGNLGFKLLLQFKQAKDVWSHFEPLHVVSLHCFGSDDGARSNAKGPGIGISDAVRHHIFASANMPEGPGPQAAFGKAGGMFKGCSGIFLHFPCCAKSGHAGSSACGDWLRAPKQR